MKKLLLLLIVIICCVVTATAQECYKVTVKSSLNVRSSASSKGAVLGTLPNGSIVDVYEHYGDWAKIKYENQYAYVSSKHLKKMEVQTRYSNSKDKGFWNNIDLNKYATCNVKWMVFVILGLSIALAFMRKDNEYDVSTTYQVLFTLTCILECIYLLIMDGDKLWFCMPGDVGWGWAILGFLAFGWLSYNQLMCFLDIVAGIVYNADNLNMSIGLYSWPIAIVAGVIAYFFEWEASYMWIIIILGLCQLIQVVMIVIGLEFEGLLNGLLSAAIYLIGAIATVLVLVQFIAILIVVVIVGMFIMGALSGGRSSSSSGSRSSSNSNEGYLDTEGGLGRIHGQFLNNDTFQEYGGAIYDKQLDGTYKKRE
ncbi:MAG: SH3 domain-containing protein [Bacteroidales bacterium]|nr:SH3 domain-containing protein [Bacteroidales bacterium]